MHHELVDNLDVQIPNAVSTTVAKKEHILEKLNKRNKNRQNYLDVKLEQRHKDNLQLEGTDYFSQAFAEKVRNIETRIKNVNEAGKKKSGGDGPTLDLGRHFTDITLEIQELQRYLTTSTMFLSDFKIKACQSIVNELTTRSEDTRARLSPKKKFGFSGRKVAPKTTLNPKLSSAATDKVDSSEARLHMATNKVINWTIANRSNEYICLQSDKINGKDITITNLENCFVELRGHAGSLQISHAANCIFLTGPIARSLFAEHCIECTLCVGCQQLRLHSSMKCRVYLHVTSRAIIEDCREIEMAPYNNDYVGIEEDFQAAGLSQEQNNYADVADFNWLSSDISSPNWRLLKGDFISINWEEMRTQFRQQYLDNAAL
uniref:C-CAP/cofactor C-like domain-containing protein n=1 Tax=Glossina austeni TaxID=7395 RepID=A0A1A9UL44_GLOAU